MDAKQWETCTNAARMLRFIGHAGIQMATDRQLDLLAGLLRQKCNCTLTGAAWVERWQGAVRGEDNYGMILPWRTAGGGIIPHNVCNAVAQAPDLIRHVFGNPFDPVRWDGAAPVWQVPGMEGREAQREDTIVTLARALERGTADAVYPLHDLLREAGQVRLAEHFIPPPARWDVWRVVEDGMPWYATEKEAVAKARDLNLKRDASRGKGDSAWLGRKWEVERVRLPTVALVQAAQRSVLSCCNRHADRQSCDCLEEAQAREEQDRRHRDLQPHPEGCWALDLILGRS